MHPHRTASQNPVAASPQHRHDFVSPEKTTPVSDHRPSSTLSDPMVAITVPPGIIPTTVSRETPARGDTVKADAPARARTLRRRLISFVAGLATASGLLLTTSGVAHADGSLPDCVHGVLGTASISTFLRCSPHQPLG